MIPQAFIQDLVARTDIVELIQRYVPLKKAGANYAACCPFHNEKSPSFTVSPAKQFYHCFGCGAHGTAIGFLMEYAGLGFVEAVQELAQQIGLAVPSDDAGFTGTNRDSQRSLIDTMAQAARFYREQLKQHPVAIDYLKKRGLTGEIAARYGIGYAPEGWQSLSAAFPAYEAQELVQAGLVVTNDTGRRYDRFRDRIMFPIQDLRANVIAFGGRVLGQGEPKYLNSPETPLFEKGRELYGLPQARGGIRDSGTVIVVEGYMDVVALAQFGIGNAVATLGTATTPTHIQKLLRQADRLVFCFDGDRAGRKAARRALEAALPHLSDDKAVAFLFLPEEHDPDSFVRDRGAEAFQAATRAATPLGRFLLDTLAEDCEVRTAEGRARLLHVAREAVPKIGAPNLRLQLVHELAHLAQLSAEDTAASLGMAKVSAAKPRGSAQRTTPPPTARAAVTPVERKLLRIVLAQPALAQRLPIGLLDLMPESPERSALMALIDAIEDGAPLDAPQGAWLEHFRGSPHEPAIAQALQALDEGLVAEQSTSEAFADILLGLELHAIDTELRALQSELARGGADPANTQRLGALLAKKQKLRTGQPV